MYVGRGRTERGGQEASNKLRGIVKRARRSGNKNKKVLGCWEDAAMPTWGDGVVGLQRGVDGMGSCRNREKRRRYRKPPPGG